MRRSCVRFPWTIPTNGKARCRSGCPLTRHPVVDDVPVRTHHGQRVNLVEANPVSAQRAVERPGVPVDDALPTPHPHAHDVDELGVLGEQLTQGRRVLGVQILAKASVSCSGRLKAAMITPDVVANDSEVRLCQRIVDADVWRSVDEDLAAVRAIRDKVENGVRNWTSCPSA
jgi:hypothetical protein